MKTWLIDKVLPNVFVAVIVTLLTSLTIIATSFFVTSLQSVSQIWVKDGTYLLANNQDGCPEGWRAMGPMKVMVTNDARQNFRKADFYYDVDDALDPYQKWYDGIELFACKKGD